MASDTKNPVVTGGKKLPLLRYKKVLILGVLGVVLVAAGVVTYRYISKKYQEADYKKATEIAAPKDTQSQTQAFNEQYDTAKQALDGKESYSEQDARNLINAALSAHALKKKAEAKKYAKAALEIVEKNEDIAREYPNIISTLKKIAR